MVGRTEILENIKERIKLKFKIQDFGKVKNFYFKHIMNGITVLKVRTKK